MLPREAPPGRTVRPYACVKNDGPPDRDRSGGPSVRGCLSRSRRRRRRGRRHPWSRRYRPRRPCHAWAAATTDPAVLSSVQWAADWHRATGLAYHPGGAGLTIVDLDDAAAIAWARRTLPRTVTVATTRGEHWIYRGTMRSANAVRPGVDIKSTMAYARWLGPGTGAMIHLPDVVRALVVKATAPRTASLPAVPLPGGGGACPHRTPVFLERGIAMAEQHIADARSAIHNTVYRVFLAVLSTHGRCGCLTEAHVERLFAAAQARGESMRHCTVAWVNARAALVM